MSDLEAVLESSRNPRCAMCGERRGPDHRLFRLPHAIADLELEGEWAAAGCVNTAAELKRKRDRQLGMITRRSRGGWPRQ